jgi:Glycosyl hydrolase family 115/Gylcosyl hydrolase family 115 C-terminal domain
VKLTLATVLVLACTAGLQANAGIGELLHSPSLPGEFLLSGPAGSAPLVIAADEWPGVARGTADLRDDIGKVTGNAPTLRRDGLASGSAVLVATLHHSNLADRIAASGKVDLSPLEGRWESYQIAVVVDPLPGVSRALVIVGSDKRGTLYGIYELSRQMGVSPWAWWADVPVRHRDSLSVAPGNHFDPGPAVRYRGIFLNDEEPSLSGWTREANGGYNSRFYARVFELILRLKGNYLWPAMWNSAFNEDDPQNPRLADEYGIVMGTSHHEPMLRAQQEWKRHGTGPWDYSRNGDVLRQFWTEGIRRNRAYDSIVTIGMRGDGDLAMSEETNTALLEHIVADQRHILETEMGRPAAQVPQLWALYKEVQAYYEHGMRVPDDVTLLWCDDNWGNIRRLPTPDERRRQGGAGVYYHFDYVGDPRNYKWLNTNPIPRVWEQMHLARAYGADRIWIVNVGDLKPMEFPIDFFLTYAWDPEALGYDRLGDFTRAWTREQFGDQAAAEAADLLSGYAALNGRRKPELIDPQTFSLIDYREAERVVASWQDLETRAEKLESSLPVQARPAFFQLVSHPIHACRIVNELLVTAGLNRLHARQGRASANIDAARARELFAEDAALTRRWDAMLGGKWRHMMDQTHLGYSSWQQPVRNIMPAVSEVQVPQDGEIGVAVEGDPDSRPGHFPVTEVAHLPPLSPYGPSSRWIEVFNRGTDPVGFSVEADQPWIALSASKGSVGPDVRIEVSANWARVPPDATAARVTVRPANGARPIAIAITLGTVHATGAGFVDACGYIAIEAPHFQRRVDDKAITWATLDAFGRTGGAVTTMPVDAPDGSPPASPAHLEYDVWTPRAGDFPVELLCAPTLDFQPGGALRIGVSVDDGPVAVSRLDTAQDWSRSVSDNIRTVRTTLHIGESGHHVLKVWRVSSAVVLERILIDTGGLRPSYLGPPESGKAP